MDAIDPHDRLISVARNMWDKAESEEKGCSNQGMPLPLGEAPGAGQSALPECRFILYMSESVFKSMSNAWQM